MKKIVFSLLTLIVSLTLLYFLLFIYFLFSFEKDFKNSTKFHSTETLNFYKKYSDKINHLRLPGDLNHIYGTNNLLFNSLNESISKNVILMQGDSWFDMINLNQYKTTQDFFKSQSDNKIINAGISSYSPSLMNIQYSILEKEFNIKPKILIVYIDQTDIGDEFCRYRNLRVHDENKKLIKVFYEHYPIFKGPFNLHESMVLSDINFNSDSKIAKIHKYFKYKIMKSINRIKKQYQFKITKEYSFEKCSWQKMVNYLKIPNNNAIRHFKFVLDEYLNMLEEREYLEKIFVVTHPHKFHISSNEYKLDISDIVAEVVLNNPKIQHINFTKIIKSKTNLYQNIDKNEGWLKDKIHLNETNYLFFIKEIFKKLD